MEELFKKMVRCFLFTFMLFFSINSVIQAEIERGKYKPRRKKKGWKSFSLLITIFMMCSVFLSTLALFFIYPMETISFLNNYDSYWFTFEMTLLYLIDIMLEKF